MGAIFKFSAKKATDGSPVAASISVGGVSKGTTPTKKNESLIVEMQYAQKYKWFAKYNNKTVASGENQGGEIVIVID